MPLPPISSLAVLIAGLASGLKPTPPPGLVFVEGGKTHIGTASDTVLAIGAKNPALFNVLASETPAYERKVESFHLMATEVTNEQYLAFVQSAGARPPQSWGRASIEEAARRWPAEEAERRKALEAKGEKAGPERRFDAAEWWRAHAADASWAIPDGEACAPVVFVDAHDARAYARWAGLRLMSEFEFQRAGRGNTNNVYPWGNDWDDKLYCSTKSLRESRARTAASFAPGATRSGLYDLSGNVWEWTSSPFVAYPGYKELQIRLQKGGESQIIDTIAHWEPKEFVLVGGSFQNGQVEARLSSRRPALPVESTDAIGFRCAASTEPFIDLAHALVEFDLAGSPLLKELNLDLEHAICADRWSSTAGSLTRTVRDADGKTKTEPLPNYAVITAYDSIAFVPAIGLHLTSLADLREEAVKTGPVRLGVFATTKRIAQPALIAGTYVFAFRAAGGDAPSDQFVWISAQGSVAATLDASGIEFRRPPNGKVSLPDANAAPAGEGAKFERVVIRAWAMSDVAMRGLAFELPLDFDLGSIGTGWRN